MRQNNVSLKQLKDLCDALDKKATEVLNMVPGSGRAKASAHLDMDRARIIEKLKSWLAEQGL